VKSGLTEAAAAQGLWSVWDSFSRGDDTAVPGALGTSESGHVYEDITYTGGADRPRYWGIVDGVAVTQSDINASNVLARISDPAYIVGPDDGYGGIFMRGTFRTGWLNGVLPTGLLLRCIDADNWLAVGVHDNNRVLRLAECRAGVVTYLAAASLPNNGNSLMAKRVVLDASIVSNASTDEINIRTTLRYSGGNVSITYDLPEFSNETWYAALLADTHVGICGGGTEGSSCYGWQAHAGGR
jgi:hypothetical protein